MALDPGTRLGLYDVIGMIGAGGMGEVYRARDPRLQRDVAIKILPAALADQADARERFRREALTAASLDHPFICKIFEIGEADDRMYIVMELIQGETMHETLSRGPLAPAEVVNAALELADALEAAHGRQMVHRDLKPANVMLTPQRHVKVMDFGLAKIVAPESDETRIGVAPSITDPGTRVGTPAYMSPEQVGGDAVDHRSDIFSLGVLLLEALTGVHPFMRNTVAGTMAAVVNDPPFVHVTRTLVDMPPSLRAVLLRMLAKSPDARYQSAAEVRSDLQSLASGSGGGSPAATSGSGRGAAHPGHRWAMVGRDAERAELGRHLNAAFQGHGGVVLIGGEPGIGKTRLTEDLLAEARGRGATAVVGHCYEMQGAPPYVPFLEITEYTARVVPPAALRRLLGEDAAEVARLMPDLRRMFPDIQAPLDLPAEQQRWYFFNAYRSYVDRASRIAPIPAVFEDLHWADEPTLQLLLHIAQTASTMPLLIVGTYRDVELDVNRPFAKVLESLLRQRLASRIALRRLPASGVDALLAAMSGRPAPSSFSRVVFRETEGNPFFVEEVFQHLKEEGRLFTAEGDWRADLQVESLDVPEGVRLVLGRRLERLGDSARRVLTTAALLGRVFSLALLEDLELGADPDAVIDAIEEAERAHLITPYSGNRDAQYMFAHELIRQTLSDGLSIPRRQRLHVRIAAAIERRHADQIAKHVSMLAHHLYQAGSSADAEKTTRYLVQAADQARAASGHEEALGYLDQAIMLWEDDESELMADLLERRAAALASLGRHGESVSTSRDAAARWQRLSNFERYGTTIALLKSTLLWTGDIPQAIAESERTRAFLTDAPGPARARHLYVDAALVATAGHVAESAAMIAAADELRLKESTPEVDLLALVAAAELAWCTAQTTDVEKLGQRAKAALLAAERPWQAVDVAWKVVWSLMERGAFDESAALNADLLALATRMGHHGAGWTLRESRAGLALLRGDLAGAEREALDAIEHARVHRIPWSYFSENRLGIALALQGRLDEALPRLRHAAQTELPSCYSHSMRASLFRFLAYAVPDEARAYFRETEIPLPVPGSLATFGHWLSFEAVVVGLHVLGDRVALARLVPVLAGSPRGDNLIWFNSPFGASAGIVRAAAGDWDAAEARFQAALAGLEHGPAQVGQGTTREWYADMLTARDAAGDRQHAAGLYEQAAAHYDRHGLVLYARHLAAKRP